MMLILRDPRGDDRYDAISRQRLHEQISAEREQKMQATLDFARSRDSKVPMPLSGAITTSTRAGAEPGRTNGDSTTPRGAVIFLGACASCHHSGGELPGIG